MKTRRILFVILAIVFALLAGLFFYLRIQKEAAFVFSPHVTQQQMQAIRYQLGMDKPLVVQYWQFVICALLAFASAAIAFVPQAVKHEPRRSIWLTLYLVLMMVVSAAAAIIYCLMLRMETAFSPLFLLALVLLSVLFFVFVLAIWNYRKWGFYGWVAVCVLVAAANIFGGLPFGASLGSLLAIPIMFLLVNPIWKTMQ